MKFISALFVIFILIISSYPVSAHGFGERYDLPLPLSYFMIGAAATVAVSFLIIGWFFSQSLNDQKYWTLNLFSFRYVKIVLKFFSFLFGVISVALLILCIFTGFVGTQEPLDNFSPTFIWIIWWVGIGYLVALLGNIWLFTNPWLILFTLLDRRKSSDPILKWNQKIESWPALILFLIFAWIENVYSGASQPFHLSIFLIIYTFYTFTGMLLFGKHVWLNNADPFHILFGLFSRFSPTEIESEISNCSKCSSDCLIQSRCIGCLECWEKSEPKYRKLNIRFFFVGLTSGEKIKTSVMFFHITALATVTFDGFAETPVWIEIQNIIWPLVNPLNLNNSSVITSLGSVFFPLFFSVIYVSICSWTSKISKGLISTEQVSKTFVFSLVPIALAYNLSHYFSFLIITGQNIIPLISDPFGFDWNLFGTKNYVPNFSIINARFVWILSVVSLVVGHIISVYVSHKIASRDISSNKLVIKTQIPMLFLMVFYTAISLWIIAQPIVE